MGRCLRHGHRDLCTQRSSRGGWGHIYHTWEHLYYCSSVLHLCWHQDIHITDACNFVIGPCRWWWSVIPRIRDFRGCNEHWRWATLLHCNCTSFTATSLCALSMLIPGHELLRWNPKIEDSRRVILDMLLLWKNITRKVEEKKAQILLSEVCDISSDPLQTINMVTSRIKYPLKTGAARILWSISYKDCHSRRTWDLWDGSG